MIKKILTIIVAYSFVIITSVQLVVNLIFVFAPEFYLRNGFYFSNFGGLSVTYLIPMVSVAFLLKYCAPSRICAIGQVIMTILWLIIKEDNIYNITAQIFIALMCLFFPMKFIKKIVNKMYNN
jgi:hypothetical protein